MHHHSNASRSRLMLTAAVAPLALAGAGLFFYGNGSASGAVQQPIAAEKREAMDWIAAAPGRVEPRTGQVRIGTALPGRVAEVVARLGDRVGEGEVLIRLDDREARARLVTAEAEAAARQRERDAQPGTAGREDVKKAEDAVFNAERAVNNARLELDAVLALDRKAPGAPQVLIRAKNRLAEAKERLAQEHVAFAAAHAKSTPPAPNRLEAAVIAARSDVNLAEEALEKTRIRAPIGGTVLNLQVKAGEMVMPSEMPLAMMGDLSLMRVRAEVDEADVNKIRLGQRVLVRSTGFPGREFTGKVSELAPSLGVPRMGSRGARRATDVEVMEVMIDLEGAVPLLPGMRAEAYFRKGD
jgi:HlyD family secretion protein